MAIVENCTESGQWPAAIFSSVIVTEPCNILPPGGHDELVELLMANGANIEHRDKKGCTPLILAASAGHAVTVAILLDHNADIEAQTDRTKDTALSLACSGGRQEVGVG